MYVKQQCQVTLHCREFGDFLVYAVDYADAELRGDAQTGTVEVSIVFRRSAAEIDAIVTVSGVNGAHAKIRQTNVKPQDSVTCSFLWNA